MAKVRILFKNGKLLDMEVDEIKVRKNPLDNDLTEISWKGAKNINPMYIRLDEVVSIFEVLSEKEEQNGITEHSNVNSQI